MLSCRFWRKDGARRCTVDGCSRNSWWAAGWQEGWLKVGLGVWLGASGIDSWCRALPAGKYTVSYHGLQRSLVVPSVSETVTSDPISCWLTPSPV